MLLGESLVCVWPQHCCVPLASQSEAASVWEPPPAPSVRSIVGGQLLSSIKGANDSANLRSQLNPAVRIKEPGHLKLFINTNCCSSSLLSLSASLWPTPQTEKQVQALVNGYSGMRMASLEVDKVAAASVQGE